MTMLKTLTRPSAKFCRGEDGATTILALYFVMISAVVGGMAIDFNKLITDRTRLQITADSVAHAALTVRQNASAADARTKALQIPETMLPSQYFGQALTGADIVFGTWNPNTRTFSPDESSREAVRVRARQTKKRANEVQNLLLGIVGINSFDAIRSSVFVAETDPCYLEGAIAEGVVKIRDDVDPEENYADDNSGDSGKDHSGGKGKDNSGDSGKDHSGDNANDNSGDSGKDHSGDNGKDNSGDSGKDNSGDSGKDHSGDNANDNSGDSGKDHSGDNGKDNSGDSGKDHSGDSGKDHSGDSANDNSGDSGNDVSNDGNYASGDCIKSNTYVKLEHDDKIPSILTDLSFVMGEDLPDYVNVLVPNEVSDDRVSPEDMDRSAVNVVSCGEDGQLELETGTYRDMVIISDCRIKFDDAVVLENTIVATTDDSSNSMIAAADLQIGRDDNCFPGGGSVLITEGGVHAAARLSIYGGQIIAGGDIRFAAQAGGFDGASLVAGGDIRGSGLINMDSCQGEGMDSNFTVAVMKMRG